MLGEKSFRRREQTIISERLLFCRNKRQGDGDCKIQYRTHTHRILLSIGARYITLYLRDTRELLPVPDV